MEIARMESTASSTWFDSTIKSISDSLIILSQDSMFEFCPRLGRISIIPANEHSLGIL